MDTDRRTFTAHALAGLATRADLTPQQVAERAVACADAVLAELQRTGPAPGPTPGPTPGPVPQPGGTFPIFDMEDVPAELRSAGFSGRDNALYFAFSRTAHDFPWSPGSDGELLALKARETQLKTYWQEWCDRAWRQLRDAPGSRAMAIVNDGPDRCGRQLGLATMKAVPDDLRGRVELGAVVPD